MFQISIPTVVAYSDIQNNFYFVNKRNYVYSIAPKNVATKKSMQQVIEKQIFENKSIVKKSLAENNFSVNSSGGPGQAEHSGFSLNTNDGLLNKFTGDMNYSIPLMDVEGFPISISYNPNITMDQEASWVGLGWDLSLGSINREMRGIPDDFSGDIVKRISKAAPESISGFKSGVSITGGAGIPFGGSGNLSVSISKQILGGRYLNSYTGVGHTIDFNSGRAISLFGVGFNRSKGFTLDDQNGIGRSSSYGFSFAPSINGVNFGGFSNGKSKSFNSRDGMYSVSRTSGVSGGISCAYGGVMLSNSKGSIQTFGVQTYIPRYQFDRNGSGSSSSLSFGSTAFYSGAFLGTKKLFINNDLVSMFTNIDNSLRSYGYYNLSKSDNDTKAMLDFNRDGTNQVNSSSKHLGFTAVTQDMYYCSAPGFTSNYRAHRYEVFELHDPTAGMHSTTESNSYGLNINGGVIGTATILGADITYGKGATSSNSTTEGANQHAHFEFTKPNQTFDGREYYLKTIGEMTPVNEGLFNSYVGFEPVRLDIAESSGKINITGNLNSNDGSFALPPTNKQLSRPDNIVHYRELNGGEVDVFGFDIQNYELFDCDNRDKVGIPGFKTIHAISNDKPKHLISAVVVTNESGMNYYFGVPSFNYQQKEVSFSASGLKSEENYLRTGMVHYNSAPDLENNITVDNSISNNRGRQQLFDATTVPSYASSFLLTKMVSSDYIDRTNDGPTPDDQGNYYKINYTNLYGEDNKYKWRMPMTGGNSSAEFDKQPNLAFFQENLNTDPWDDVANYIYGEKDLWYGQSVESRNFIAYFCLGDRIDMFSAEDEDGGLDTKKPGKYLKRIELYSRAELAANPKAKPIQVVEFQYDYSLCSDYVCNTNSHDGFYGPNTGQGSGKLTLKRIFSYSGKSGEMKTTPIDFEYNSENPDFAFNSSDRWGNYKPNDITRPNHLIPYSEQNAALANDNIQAWKLKKIINSSGSEIEFFFEADSYSYVQNERAMRMFNVVGLSDMPTLNDLSDVSDPNFADLVSNGVSVFFRDPNAKKEYYDVVYFELEEAIDVSDLSLAHEMVKKKYFTDAKGNIPDEFLFNMNVKLGRETEDDDVYETVQSMAKLGKGLVGGSYIGVVGQSGPFKYGYVVIQSDKINEESDHYYVTSLQLANWQFARLNAPYSIYGEPNYAADNPQDFCNYSNSLDFRVLFDLDINKKINRLEYGNKFLPSRSYIRLFEPDGVKFGGNAKLVSIKYSDGWNSISGEAESMYKWNYDYSSQIEKRSSGVAAYEPKVGGDENSLYLMDAYSTKRFNLPDEKSYQFLPLAEILFPAPVVGYEDVSTYFADTEMSVAKSVGKNIVKFHTSRTYPTIVEYTERELIDKTGENAIIQNGITNEFQGYSEGFTVISNDFHGKIAETSILGASGDLISKSKYIYVDPKLGKVKYLYKDGTVVESVTPREIDIYTESWRNSSKNLVDDNSKTLTVNALILPNPPFIIPYILGTNDDYSSEINVNVSGFTFEKVINHSAVVDSIETFSLGSHNTAKNEIFDPKSGSVLLSSLKDEFNDKLFSFSYPAHWKYETFLNSNQTDNALFSDVTGTGNIISVSSPLGLSLSVGDMFAIYTSGVFVKFGWILDVNGSDYSVINFDGSAMWGIDWENSEIRIIRTGRKNILDADMMSVTTKVNPISGSTFSFPDEKLISSSASMFLENNNVPCTQINGINSIEAFKTGTLNTSEYVIGAEINPFLKGLKGNFRPYSSFTFQNDRTNFEDPNGIRQNGTLKNYIPFYKYVGDKWIGINEPGHPNYVSGNLGSWRSMGQINQYSEFGSATQSIDQIKIAQSGISAINRDFNVLQSASSVNASVNEIGFDGFEVYSDSYGVSTGVPSTQFSLSELFNNGATLSSDEMHTGDHSIQISGTNTGVEFKTYEPVSFQPNIWSGEYFVRACNCVSNFAPEEGKDYLLSVWIKEQSGVVPYQQTRIVVEYEDEFGDPSGTQQIFYPEGAVIEGWQKIEGKYTIPSGTSKVRFYFQNTGSDASYFDDFRTHPFLAGMTSIVYDAKTLLPLAEHDGYNYATFYNYDDNYQLVRIKVETVEGIKTITETSRGTRRTN